jgi:cysteine desulfurase / selenocysteine lyase
MLGEKIRKDFPILAREEKGKRLVYLDNAATSQKPRQVIDSLTEFYTQHNANIHRGIHRLSEEATDAYETAREKTAKLINSEAEETIFTKGTTESINLLSTILKDRLKSGDEILISELEHHSNIVPWQMLAKERSAKLRFIPVNKQGELQFDEKLITKKTKIVSVAHISNVLGTVNDIKRIGSAAKDNKSTFIIDAAQSAPHLKLDVKKMDCDFLAFSGHKMMGPTGTGVLYGKKELLECLPVYQTGGNMIKETSLEDSSWKSQPWKYEAGTPNIAGAIGFGAAIDYLNKIGFEEIEDHEMRLSDKLRKQLSDLDFVENYSPKSSRSVFSFNLEGIHPHDAATILDKEMIAVRSGHHCAMPLMEKLGLKGTIRASIYIYNTKEELDLLTEKLKEIRSILKK